MISFRYHLITIVAIFLAIALGIVMGATFIQDPLLGRLRSQTDELKKGRDALRQQVNDLQARADASDAFAQQIFPWIASGRLAGTQVLVVTQDGTSDDDVDAVRSALDRAGARVQTELSITERMASDDPGTMRGLADALGLDPNDSPSLATLQGRAAGEMARRIADGPSTPGADLFADLLDRGFLVARHPTVGRKDVALVGGPGTVTVVVAGGAAQPPLPPDAVLLPMLRTMVSAGVRVAGAEGTDSSYPFVGLVSDDGDLSDRVSTVEGVDQPIGAVALVLALGNLVDGGAVGHYGTGNQLLPSPTPAPTGP